MPSSTAQHRRETAQIQLTTAPPTTLLGIIGDSALSDIASRAAQRTPAELARPRPAPGRLPLDQTPAFDPTDAEPIPAFVFDQSLPDELDN